MQLELWPEHPQVTLQEIHEWVRDIGIDPASWRAQYYIQHWHVAEKIADIKRRALHQTTPRVSIARVAQKAKHHQHAPPHPSLPAVKIRIFCPDCSRKVDTEFDVELIPQNDCRYEIDCPNGHRFLADILYHEFQKLFEVAINALADNYYREAIERGHRI